MQHGDGASFALRRILQSLLNWLVGALETALGTAAIRGVTTMSSATTSVASVSTYTEQSAPRADSGSQNTQVPDEMFIVLILSFILWVLLAWRAIERGGTARAATATAAPGFHPSEVPPTLLARADDAIE